MSEQRDGFELEGIFYPWAVSDGAKDMLLIDRFTGLPIHEFFEQIEDGFDRGRAPILLASLATSIRARHPEWSVERITRLVLGLSLSDVAFIAGTDEEAGEDGPPSQAAPEAAEASASPSDGSKPFATLQATSLSETSVATPD